MTTLDTLTLPAGLLWPDEYTAQSVTQTRRRTLDGGQVVFYAPLTAGRTITLESGPDTGWLTRTQVEALAALAQSPGAVYTLTIRDQTYRVLFRHDDPPAFEATPVIPFTHPGPDDYYLGRIKLVTA